MATGRIGVTPTLRTRWSKQPSAGTTSLSGLDDNSVSLVYDVGYEAVYRNGVLLSRTNDYTATTGNSITLIDATIAGDIIEVFANQLLPLTNAIGNGQYTAKGALLSATAASTPAVLTVGANDTVLTADSSTATGLKWAAAASGSTFVGVSVTRTGHKNISTDTTTTIDFDSEFYDTDGFHSNTTNNDRLTVPSGKAGKYLVVFQTQWQANESSANSYKFVYILKNGNNVARTQLLGVNGNCQQTYQTSAIVDLAVGDYINTTVYIGNTSSAADLYFSTATPYYSYLSMAYLGA